MFHEFSIDQMWLLAHALGGAGFTPDDVKKLTEFRQLKDLKMAVSDHLKIMVFNHSIDCDADPKRYNNWKIQMHRRHGQLEFNSKRIELYWSDKQKDGKGFLAMRFDKNWQTSQF